MKRSTSQNITIATFVAEFFSQKKITDVFMVTGGGAMFLNDAFSRNKKLKSYCFHHEQACSMAAEAYFKVAKKPAIVNVTTGPGATNAITGVYGAYVDSSAMIVVSGQVKRPTMKRYHSENLRQLGDQEIDIIPMVKSITKYAVVLDDPKLIEHELNRAYEEAVSGRPGPVWLDIPIDIQSMKLPPQKIRKIKPTTIKKAINKATMNLLFKQLMKAQRPVIICGNGIHLSSTSKELLHFAQLLKIPIVSSFCASDVIPTSNPLFIGRQGTIGDRAGNFAVQSSDLLLILGARMNIRQVSYDWKQLAPRAFKVMVDVDKHELDKPTLKPNLKINANLKDFFIELFKLPLLSIPSKFEYLKWCQDRKKKYPAVLPAYYESKEINPYVFMKELSLLVPDKTVTVTADGAAAITSFQVFETKIGQRLFSNSGSAPMGFDLPAVIGASIAVENLKDFRKRVLCFAGDGSIMMNLQELQTIKTLGKKITVFILNNGGYLSILQTQNNYFKDNVFGCVNSPELSFPDFRKICTGFDLNYSAIRSLEDLKLIPGILNADGPNVCEVFVDPKQLFEPKLVSKRLEDGSFVSPELDDMYPFLSEVELRNNRII